MFSVINKEEKSMTLTGTDLLLKILTIKEHNNNIIDLHQINKTTNQHNKATNNPNNTHNAHKKLIIIIQEVNGNSSDLVTNITSTQNLIIMPILPTMCQVKKFTQISKENSKAKPKINKSFSIKCKNILSINKKSKTKRDKIFNNIIAKWNNFKNNCMKKKDKSFLILQQENLFQKLSM